jgi:hypothetical protein
MHIETTVGWNIEHVLRQYQTISGNNQDVGLQCCEACNGRFVTKTLWLQHDNPALLRVALHGAGCNPTATACRAVWLRIHSDNGVSGVDQRGE